MKKNAAAAVFMTGTLLLAMGCSPRHENDSTMDPREHALSSQRSSVTKSEAFNSDDVLFNQKMLLHHEQAVEMANLIDGRSQSAAMIEFGEAVIKDQQPQIDEIINRLRSWNKDETPPEGTAVPGLQTRSQMNDLRNTRGSAFDSLWLKMMMAHHKGAIDMSKTELQNGKDPASRALAKAIAESQHEEMKELQKSLDGQPSDSHDHGDSHDHDHDHHHEH